MKKPRAPSSNHILLRDLVVLVGVAALTLGLGRFTPLLAYAFASVRQGVGAELFVGVLFAVAVVAVLLLIVRDLQPPRSATRVEESAPARETLAAASPPGLTEHSPYPVLEVTVEGAVCQANPAARSHFPDLEASGALHPILQDLSGLGAAIPVVREVVVKEAVYEQKVVRVPGLDRLYLYLRDITPRKQAQEALRTSEQKFEGTFRSAPIAISINRLSDGRFIDVNDHFLCLLGLAGRDEVIGRTATELDMWVQAGNRARVLELLTQDDRAAHRYETRVYTADDHVRDVIVSVVLIEVDGEACVLSALLDVTEHREAEAGLGMLKAFYENTLRELPIQVAVLDDEARFIYLNPAAMRDEETRVWMAGKTSVDFALAQGVDPAPYQRRHAWLLDVIARKEMSQLEETLTTHAGEQRHLLRVAAPVLDDAGALIYVVGYGIDMTERMAFERQLMEAKSAAEEMARLKSSFVANMSHEIRTPLTAILGFATVLGEELEGEQRELADIIKQSGDRLLETLNSVLDLARLEAQALDMDPLALNVGEELQAAARLFRPMAEAKTLALEVDLPAHPVRAQLDRALLHRVLSNLLSNAIKFTEEGEVRIVLTERDDAVIIQVNDTGIGISEAFRPHLFEEFKQESTGLARTHNGSGLGLAITRHLVERMQGQIGAESTKGEGACFTVILPKVVRQPTNMVSSSGSQDQLNLFSPVETIEPKP